MVISIEIKRYLKRDGDIGRKAVLSDVKTALRCTPALRRGRRQVKNEFIFYQRNLQLST